VALLGRVVRARRHCCARSTACTVSGGDLLVRGHSIFEQIDHAARLATSSGDGSLHFTVSEMSMALERRAVRACQRLKRAHVLLEMVGLNAELRGDAVSIVRGTAAACWARARSRQDTVDG
jgi:hypothetical protein